MKQTFTVFRSEKMLRRENGALVDHIMVSQFPGFGTDAEESLDEVMESIAETESDLLQEADDDEYDTLLNLAVEQLPGDWEIYPGIHSTRPAGDPAHSLTMIN